MLLFLVQQLPGTNSHKSVYTLKLIYRGASLLNTAVAWLILTNYQLTEPLPPTNLTQTGTKTLI